MLEQFVAVMPGTLAPALLVMSLSVMLTVGEGRDKPISSHWRLIGLIVGLIAAIVFAGLRASAVINQRTFVNYPVLWCAIIADILTIVVVVFARRITTNWQQHKVFMHIANAVAAIDIALTLFYALPDVILQLAIWVEPGRPHSLRPCCCALLVSCLAWPCPLLWPPSSARCAPLPCAGRSPWPSRP